MSVTLKQIADKARVSPSTVSFALRDTQPGNVSIPEKTRRRICRIAKEMGYRPNRIAASLVNKQTQMIGILIPTLHGDFYGRVFNGINQAISPDYMTVMAVHNYDGKRERADLEVIMGNNLDGVIAAFSGYEENIPLYRELTEKYHIPLVLIDRSIPGLQLPIVHFDNYAMSYESVKALNQLGHTQILYAGVVPEAGRNLDSFKQCEEGFHVAMRELNLEDQVQVIIRPGANDWSLDILHDFAREIMDYRQSSFPKPTAIMLNHDWLGYEVLAECEQRGINIPDDLSLMGMNDCDSSKLPGVGLSSVGIKTDLEMLGQKAAELLMQRINGRLEDNPQIILPIEVITRRTTKALERHT